MTLTTLLLFASIQARPPAPAVPLGDPEATPLTCRLEEREGTRVLFLAGTMEERGFGEGRLLCGDIVDCFEEFAIPYVTGDNPPLWDLIVRPGVLLRFRIPADTHLWSKALVEGMESAAGGSIHIESLGRDLDAIDVLAWSALPDLSGFACSSLAVWDGASSSGDVLVGRNLDYSSSPTVQRNSLVEVHAPFPAEGDRPGRAGWVGMGWPGTFGCLTGLSEHGVFASIHDVHDGEPRAMARFSMRMLALSEFLEWAEPCDSLPKAFAQELRTHPFAMGGNFLIAWQAPTSRGAAVIEVGTDEASGGISVRQPAEKESWIACSNDHFLREGREPRCERYSTLREGARAALKGDGMPLDGVWELVQAAGMSITLYRCVADLGSQTMTVERRVEGGWAARTPLLLSELLEHSAPVSSGPGNTRASK